LFCFTAAAAAEPPPPAKKRVAALVADWFHNSHPDVLLTRILETYSRDGKGLESQLELASVYRDLPTEKDLSRRYAAKYGFKIADSIEDALTLGTGKLAVDGVIISTEWAPYPLSDTGQFVYPHRRMFDACARVFEASGRVVPVFVDKHLADTWQDSKHILDTAREMRIPLMAGSCIPLCLKAEGLPEIPLGSELKEIVGISYHTLTTYGFHGVEMIQAIAERRKGGETGVRRVRCLNGDAVWDAAGKEYDVKLFEAAVEKVGARIPGGKTLRQAVAEPVLFVIEYADGMRASLFTLNGAAAGWSAAWAYKDGRVAGALMSNEASPGLARFDWQMKGVEDLFVTRKASWPVERTWFSSATLDAALVSKRDGGKVVETPFLMTQYAADDAWHVPETLRSKRREK
jgi:hypothetical protein